MRWNRDQYQSPDADLIRELYARFGLAYYYSECLHCSLSFLAALLDFEEPRHMTGPRIEEKLSYTSSRTLGQIVQDLENKVSEELFGKLTSVLERRNYLAHRFWFEQAIPMTTATGIGQLIPMLGEIQDQFKQVDSEVEDLIVPKLFEIGVTSELLQETFEKVLKDEHPEQTLRQRNLRSQERLVRVWRIGFADGSMDLIFEIQDGSLWQLCDVGLGWTYHRKVESEWQEERRITRYLPANINPRPDDAQPWSYDLVLGNKAAIQVSPGRKAGSYQWRLKEFPTERNKTVT